MFFGRSVVSGLSTVSPYLYEIMGGVLIFFSSWVTEPAESRRRKSWIFFGALAIAYAGIGIGIRSHDKAEVDKLQGNISGLVEGFKTLVPMVSANTQDVKTIHDAVSQGKLKIDPNLLADLEQRSRAAQNMADYLSSVYLGQHLAGTGFGPNPKPLCCEEGPRYGSVYITLPKAELKTTTLAYCSELRMWEAEFRRADEVIEWGRTGVTHHETADLAATHQREKWERFGAHALDFQQHWLGKALLLRDALLKSIPPGSKLPFEPGALQTGQIASQSYGTVGDVADYLEAAAKDLK